MTLLGTEKAELHQYYLVVGRQRRSTQGPILEKAWMGTPWESEADFADHFKGRESLAPAEPYLERRHAPETTVEITAEQRIEPSTEMDLGTQYLLGKVSKKLNKLCQLHRDALEAFHGDAGACFESLAARVGMAATKGRVPMYGRIASIFRLTKAGKVLLRRARQGSKLKVTDDQLVQNVVAQDDGESGSTLGKAHEQALALLERAEKAYARAGRSELQEAVSPPAIEPTWDEAAERAYAPLRHGPVKP
jgi:hypothetical protein